MKKIMISIVVMVVLLAPILTSEESHMLPSQMNVSSSSTNQEFIEVGQNFIYAIDNAGNLDPNSLTIADSVMDDEGSTYVAGFFERDTGLLLGEIEVMNQNIPPSGQGRDYYPIIAKFDSNGELLWHFAPLPEPGITCDSANSIIQQSDAHGKAKSLALDWTQTKLIIVGQFQGCFKMDASIHLFNNDADSEDGYVLNLNAIDGTLDWVERIDTDGSPGGQIQGLFLNTVAIDKANEQIFVGGSVQNTVASLATATTNIVIEGDQLGDAYVAAFDLSDGTPLTHFDSCITNDGGGIDCNPGNSRERVETLDVLGGELIAGIEVFTKGGGGGIVSIELFDSQFVDHMDQTSSIYGWKFETSSYASALNAPPLNFGLIPRDNQEIITSYRTGSDVLFLVDGMLEDVAIASVASNNAITFDESTVSGQPKLSPLGISEITGSTDYLVLENSGGVAGSFNINWIDAQGQSQSSPLAFSPNDSMMMISMNPNSYGLVGSYAWMLNHNDIIMSSNGDYSSFIGKGSMQHKAMIVTSDSDMDGIPNLYDIHPNVPSYDDDDNDGILNNQDNCRYKWNSDQVDTDSDGNGDACDSDIDGDGVLNSNDDCPYINPLNQDLNGDGCTDSDIDGDGVIDEFDECPGENDQLDEDNDDIIDGCDPFENDTDNDGRTNDKDNCIYVQNYNQANMDDDAQGDACDSDIDGDGVSNVAPIHESIGTSEDLCPYVDATGFDENQDGCIDEVEPVECEVCKEPVKGNETNTLLDPDDVTTVAAVGGAGAVGGGALAFVLSKLRRATRFIGIDDGLEALKHLPKRKKEDAGSDHYFQRGLVRQREMTLSADKNLDDYIEENEKEGVEKK